jgi:hypothetical protein
VVAALVGGAFLAGCGSGGLRAKGGASDALVKVPEPIHRLLPRSLSFHPFTEARTFAGAGGIKGFEVRIWALDHSGDATKAFGVFRFEMFAHRAHQADRKGDRIVAWQRIDLTDYDDNLVHWNHTSRAYVFNLKWDRPLPVGQKFVLRATFDSPFTERLFAEHVFTAGE